MTPPAADAAVERHSTSGVHVEHRRTESTARRLLAGALAITVMTGLAALAGVGLARGSISAAQYQYGKVTVCHKTKSKKHPQVTITVSRSALPAHLKHGDTEGACPKAAASSKGKGSEKKDPSANKGSEKGSEKGAEKGAEKKGPEKGADPPAKEKEKEKGEKEKGEKEHGGGGGENGGGQGNGNGGGGGKGKGK